MRSFLAILAFLLPLEAKADCWAVDLGGSVYVECDRRGSELREPGRWEDDRGAWIVTEDGYAMPQYPTEDTPEPVEGPPLSILPDFRGGNFPLESPYEPWRTD